MSRYYNYKGAAVRPTALKSTLCYNGELTNWRYGNDCS